MSILVTGANGEIGFDLVKRFSQKNKVFAIFRTKNYRIRKIKNVKWIKWDLKKKIEIKFTTPIKYIVHCAIDQKYLGSDKNKYLRGNTDIIKNVISFAKKNDVDFIMNLSSVDVYGDLKIKSVTEGYLPIKKNMYANLKYLSEKELFKQKINFINLRLPGTLCDRINLNVLRPWLFKTTYNIYKNNQILVKNTQNKFNNVIRTLDIVNFFYFIIKKKIVVRDTYNFSAIQPIKLNSILDMIKKKLNSNTKVIELIDKKKSSFLISNTKIKSKLKYRLPTTKLVIKSFLQNFNDQVC